MFHSCIRWPSFVTFALPEFEATPKGRGEVARPLSFLKGEMKRKDLQDATHLRQDDHLRMAYLLPTLEAVLIEMTTPEKIRSRKQKHRLTEKEPPIFDRSERRLQVTTP